MKMNKRLLVTAVSTALLLNAVDSMAAAYDMSNATPVPLTYAKEILMPSTGKLQLTDDATATPQDITGYFSTNVIPSGSSVQLKVTLTNAVFGNGAAPMLKGATAGAGVIVPTGDTAPFSGGVGSSTVTFVIPTTGVVSVAGPIGTAAAATNASKYLIDVSGIEVANTSSPVSVKVETTVTAGSATATTATNALPYIAFENALTFKCTAGNAGATIDHLQKVDVTKNSLLFTNTPFTGSAQGKVSLGLVTTPATPMIANSATATVADILASDTVKFTNLNGWAAFAATGGSVKLGTTAATILANDATVTHAASVAIADTALNLTVPAAGTIAIADGDIKATFAGVAKTGYTNVSASCDLSPIAKTGSEDRLNVMLTPNGAYKNFIRITNPSTINGKVYLNVIDDAGVSAPLSLTEAGQTSDTLLAGASSPLIDINVLGAAAKVKKPTFNVAGKMRLIANGDFGSNENGQSSSSINLQSFSLSSDSKSFSMMNAK